jgi:hypothetical protein
LTRPNNEATPPGDAKTKKENEMPVLALVELLIQVFFAVHALRTGRPCYWLFIIICFPIVGSLIYLFAEFLPSLQHNRGFQGFQSNVGRMINPTKRLRHLEDQVEITPSVKNKEALAEEYARCGIFDNAILLYESCLQGVHENDQAVIDGLCQACFFKADYGKANHYFSKRMEVRGNEKRDELDILHARTLEGLGDIDGARTKYSEIADSVPGEEARCRYALLMKQTGRIDEANELFNKVLKNARLSPKYYRKTQKEWILMAEKERTML